MDRIATTVRIDRSTRDMLNVIGKANGVAINAIVNQAIAAYVDRESRAIERDLSETLDRVRSYRAKHRDHGAAIAALVAAELAKPDPAEADTCYRVDPHRTERSILAILDDEA